MTLSALRTRTANLVAYEGTTTEGSDPSGSTLDEAINWAQDVLSKRLYLYSSVTFTTSGSTNVYDTQSSSFFGRRMLSVDLVVINGTTLRDKGGQYGMYSFPEFNAWYPTWQTAGSGTVEAACFTNPNLIITPSPSGSISNSYVRGRHLALALASSSDVSELPEQVHELIPYLAAIYIQEPVIDAEESWKRLEVYRLNAAEDVPQLYIDQFRAVHGVLPSMVPGLRGSS